MFYNQAMSGYGYDGSTSSGGTNDSPWTSGEFWGGIISGVGSLFNHNNQPQPQPQYFQPSQDDGMMMKLVMGFMALIGLGILVSLFKK